MVPSLRGHGGLEGALSDKQETLTFSSALSSVSSHCEWQSPGTEGRGGGIKGGSLVRMRQQSCKIIVK